MDIKSIFDKEDIYVYINKKSDILHISKEKSEDTNKIPIIPKAEKWSKNELAGAIKAFHVRQVEYDGENIPIKDIYTSRPEPYEKAVKGYHRMYTKKIIFLFKKTGGTKYLKLLTRQKFIILAKPDAKIDTDFDIYVLSKTKIMPVFSESTEINNFINDAKDNGLTDVSEYKPLCLKYRELYFFIKKKYPKYTIVLDPYAATVKDVSFSLYMPNKFLEFMFHNRDKTS